MENKTSAKDFFLHLGAIASLYAIVAAFLNLLFSVINKAYPQVTDYVYFYSSGPEISMAVATLIIVFPIFIILSRFINKTYAEDESKKHLGVRKWLIYVTLFIAGIILTGDLVAVLYKFLDGQDLTAAFLLKALSVLVVSGGVFGYYLQDIRERITVGARKKWAVVSGVIILLAIILGFSVIGSPKTQRLIRLDNQKITDLQNLQWQIINHWQLRGSIPSTLADLTIKEDPFNETDFAGLGYEYKKTGELSFELCATFNKASEGIGTDSPLYDRSLAPKGLIMMNENWKHPAGMHCFTRAIDPIQYPTQVRG